MRCSLHGSCGCKPKKMELTQSLKDYRGNAEKCDSLFFASARVFLRPKPGSQSFHPFDS